MLTIAEVGEFLRVDPSTVRRWIHSGDLVAIRVGKHYRVERSALATYLGVPLEQLLAPAGEVAAS